MSVRVLIAEDFALFREGVEIALEADPDIEVVGHAVDGREAFDRARELHPDVILLDLRMPEHGGMEALDHCRENLPETKILVLTANVNPDNLRDAMTVGAAGYLTKQTSGKELCRAVMAVHRGGSVVPPALGPRMPEEESARADGDLPQPPGLSARERSIVRLLSRGLTDNEIAERLFVAPRTVQYDLANVRKKTGLASRSEIARWAIIHSLN